MNKQSRYMLRQNLSYYKNRIKYGITKLHSTVSDNYIVFESYGGKKATDSVRAIYDELQKDENSARFILCGHSLTLQRILIYWKTIIPYW